MPTHSCVLDQDSGRLARPTELPNPPQNHGIQEVRGHPRVLRAFRCRSRTGGKEPEVSTLRKLCIIAVLISGLIVPSMVMAQSSGFTNNHFEVGAFVDYFRLSAPDPAINDVGVGGRVGFNPHPNVALEAEMAYNFERNITTTTST